MTSFRLNMHKFNGLLYQRHISFSIIVLVLSAQSLQRWIVVFFSGRRFESHSIRFSSPIQTEIEFHFGFQGNLGALEFLLLNRAKVNVSDVKGVTPLHIATTLGNTG